MQFTIATLVALAASASALQVTYPGKDAKLDLTKDNTIQWNSVSTDPSSFDIYLVDNSVYPSVSTKVASNVDTSKGSYTFKLKSTTAGSGYQINLVSDDTQNTGILAQSQQFDVTEAGSTSTSAVTFTDTTTGVSSTTTSSGTATSTTSTSSTSSSSGATTSSGTVSTSTTSRTSSATHASSTANASSTATSNAGSAISVSAGAGTFLMGLFALFL